MVIRIGVDLGGTKIEAIALDAAGAVRARRRVPTPRDDYPATLRAIAGLVEAVEGEVGERGTVGIGMPGAISPAPRPRPPPPHGPTPALRERRELLRALRGARRRGGGGPRGVRRDRGDGDRGRSGGGRPHPHGAERDRRRVGTQPAALAAGGRVAGALLLLRQDR